MNRITLATMLLWLISFSNANAISVGAITEIMPSDQNMLAKEIKNTVGDARLVELTIEGITSPLEGGKPLPTGGHGEIMSTPASLILPGNADDVFRIFYNGPKDDHERYYHLQWSDNPVAEEGITKTKKSATATTSATISTILVVAPRIENFKYSFNDGIIHNNGNSTFRVVAVGPCVNEKHNHEGCKERYYVMPGLGAHLKFVDYKKTKSSIGIWHNENFIVVK